MHVMEVLRRLLNVSGPALIGAVVLAVMLPGSASAKGFTRAILVGSDGRWVEIHAQELTIDGLLSTRGSVEPIRGGYVRLFFVGPGDFPVSPGRYYPEPECVALDWPTYERSCRRINPALVRMLRPARSLPRFRCTPDDPREHQLPRPTVRHDHNGGRDEDPVELALDRQRSVGLPPGILLRVFRAVGGPVAARTTAAVLALCRWHLRQSSPLSAQTRSLGVVPAECRLMPFSSCLLRRRTAGGGAVCVIVLVLLAATVAPWTHPLSFGQLPGWETGRGGAWLTRPLGVGRTSRLATVGSRVLRRAATACSARPARR